MTLIIGVKCSDGVVVGSDGAATLGESGMMTARHTMKKLEIIGGRVIVGLSGYSGLAVRVKRAIELFWENNKATDIPIAQIERLFIKEIRPILEEEIRAAGNAQKSGALGSLDSAICCTLMAIPLKLMNGNHNLFYANHIASFDQANEQVSFFTTGSGIKYADPFLRFLYRIYWKDAIPDVAGGILTVLWTLKHVIDSNAGDGVSDPIQIATLTFNNTTKKYEARELSDVELDESNQQIERFEERMKAFLSYPLEDARQIEPPPLVG